MSSKLGQFTAYHGRGWVKRKDSLSVERSNNQYWSSWTSNSEYMPLKAVLLFIPGREIESVKNPDEVHHLHKISSKKIRQEFVKIKEAFQKEKVLVFQINPHFYADKTSPNLMYVRDLFWNSPEGAVISRMASPMRGGEEKYATATLSLLSIPIISTIHGKGLLEGADLLWLNKSTLLCGIGNRTNQLALKQLQNVLSVQKIKLIMIPLPKNVQHLLGLLQIIDQKKALLRTKLAPLKLKKLLMKEKFKIIEIPECHEVTHLQGMNIVTIRPNEIFMPSNCPFLRETYKKNKIKILAELNISQISAGAGGLACVTGILGREIHE